jgi:hypothetical protein
LTWGDARPLLAHFFAVYTVKMAANASLVLKGVTFNHTRYVVSPDKGLKPLALPTDAAPWRMCYNGNPRGMWQYVKSSLPPETNVLFIVQRDVNRNVVVYAYSEAERRVHAFWFMVPASARRSPARYDEDKEEDEEVDVGEAYAEGLTLVEETMAYGVSPTVDGAFTVKALEGRQLRVVKEGDEWVATCTAEGRHVVLRDVFICTEASSWRPWPTTTECHLTCSEDATKPTLTYHYSVVM